MPEQMIANQRVELDDEGFLTNPDEWTEDIARELAKSEGIEELTDSHWKVINFMRSDFSDKGQPPSIRRINKVGGVSVKDLYNLFPKGPAKKAAKISGLSKPQGCV
jgi:tRNA 2-thiouridine synthesizing protein E